MKTQGLAPVLLRLFISQQCIQTIALSQAFTRTSSCSRMNPALSQSHAISSDRPSSTGNLLYAKASQNDEDSTTSDMNPLTKASWYAVEAFGKVFGGGEGSKSVAEDASTKTEDVVDLTRAPSSLSEALRRIEMDNERSYFLSGEVDVKAYDEDCVFADPFVSFSGRDRFVENLANLGSFITEYDARMINYEVKEEGTQVQTKVMVKLELNLPWKPILAWPWGVTFTIDPDTMLITKHVESWDIEPIEGVKQIFRKPTTKINKKKE